jgi:hypothetical protein
MTTRPASLTLLTAIGLLCATPTVAHLGEVVYPIYELSTADLPNLHDQSLEDWEAVLPSASLTHNDFVYNGGVAARIDPENLAWRVFLAWHHASQRIYVAVERLDDDYWPRSEEGPGDPTYLYVDGDHSGGQFSGFDPELPEDERKRAESVQAQRFSMVAETRSDNQEDFVWVGGWAYDWVRRSPWTDAGGFQYGESPNVSGVEAAVTLWDDLHWQGPELSTRSSLEPGAIIGFMVDIWDIDRDDRTLEMFSLAEVSRFTSPAISFAEDFVDGELIPCFTSDSSGARQSAAEADSWGRIKSTFR